MTPVVIAIVLSCLPFLARDVVVSVHVTACGVPLENVSLCVRDGVRDTYGKTDGTGTAVIHKSISTKQTWLAVIPSMGMIKGETDQVYDARVRATGVILEAHAFAQMYRVPLVV